MIRFSAAIVLLVVCSILVVSAKRTVANDNDLSMRPALVECQKSLLTRVPAGVLNRIRLGRQTDVPANYAAHKLCIYRGIEVINEDNTINLELFKKRIYKDARYDQDVETIVSECGQYQLDAKGTAANIAQCLLKYDIDI